MSGTSATPDGLTPTGRVPAEHRVLGVDRRSLLPGGVVIAIFVLWTIVVPAINDALSYGQETKAGDVFLIQKGLTMEAQPGWGVESGLLTTEKVNASAPSEAVVISNGATSLSVTPGKFKGTPEELLGQIKKVESAITGDKAFHIGGDVATFHTDEGHPGVAQAYTTVTGMGVVSALVYGDTGLKINFTGPIGALEEQGEEIGDMIDSITYEAGAAK